MWKGCAPEEYAYSETANQAMSTATKEDTAAVHGNMDKCKAVAEGREM